MLKRISRSFAFIVSLVKRQQIFSLRSLTTLVGEYALILSTEYHSCRTILCAHGKNRDTAPSYVKKSLSTRLSLGQLIPTLRNSSSFDRNKRQSPSEPKVLILRLTMVNSQAAQSGHSSVLGVTKFT